MQSPQEALRGALRHPLDGCRSRAGGTCLEYIDLLDPKGLTSSRICLLYNLSCSIFTPYSPLPISPLIFKSFLLLFKKVVGFKKPDYLFISFIYTYYPPLKSRDNPNGNSIETLWKAVALRQKGPSNSKKLWAYKALNKTTVYALVPRYIKSLKTLTHPQLLTI